MNHTVVILAAGLGTRMRSKKAKVLHRAGGLALVEQVVSAARTLAPYERIVVVTGHQAETVEALLQPLGVGCSAPAEAKEYRSRTGIGSRCGSARWPAHGSLWRHSVADGRDSRTPP